MKSTTSLLFFSLLTFYTSAQIFVNDNASGDNDGTSWTNAFVDLSDAIDSAIEEEQIWIAAGTYKPGGVSPDRRSTFSININLELYGGFSGNETNLDERDVEANETILSGDILGDDIDDNFVDFKEDNVIHVMVLDESIQARTIIDGLTFAYGHTEGILGVDDDRRGGAMLTNGSDPKIRNCTFTQNYGYFGGAIHFRAGFNFLVTPTNCKFINNSAFNGGAFYANQVQTQFEDCLFQGNTAREAGVGYCDDNNFTHFTRCQFISNSSEFDGGALIIAESFSRLEDCVFENNISENGDGGHIYDFWEDDHDRRDMRIERSEFKNGSARNGGAISAEGENTRIEIFSSIFSENVASASSGALDVSNIDELTILESSFSENQARRGGVAQIGFTNNTIIMDSKFESNNSTSFAGGVRFFGTTDETEDRPTVVISRTLFHNNNSEDEGAGLMLSNVNSYIDNCQLTENTSNERGGGIMVSGSSDVVCSTVMTNCTIAANNAPFGSNVVLESVDGTNTLYSKNNIYAMPSVNNFTFVSGIIALTSEGGNLFDTSIPSLVSLQETDLVETDPIFVDAQNGDYNLGQDSPAIDSGLDIDSLNIDLDGFVRLMPRDRGALEYKLTDNDGDGSTLVFDCDDSNPEVNPDQMEVPYNGLDDDCDPLTLDDDLDQDGFLSIDDCDDNNPDVNPNQMELAYNGLDDDCDPLTLDDDLDQDGFEIAVDCNDTDPSINPDAEDIPNNGIDEDCDGEDSPLSTYELANTTITIFPNPTVNVINISVVGNLDYKASLYDMRGKLIKAESKQMTYSLLSSLFGMNCQVSALLKTFCLLTLGPQLSLEEHELVPLVPA